MSYRTARSSLIICTTLCAALLVGLVHGGHARADDARNRTLFLVSIAPNLADHPVSGRLIVFLAKGAGKAGETMLGPSFLEPESVYFTAVEVHNLEPGKPVEVRADELAFPGPLSGVPAGAYRAQALL